MREGDTLVNLFSWERRGFLSLSDTHKKELKSSVDLLFLYLGCPGVVSILVITVGSYGGLVHF